MKTVKLLLPIVILTALFLSACGGRDGDIYITGSDPTPPAYTGATPPAGDPGTATFESNGGNATESGYGGYGGGIDIESVGDVWITTSGSVDTSFTVPTPTPAYGDNKLTISANKTVQLDLAGNCDAGDVYLTSNSTDLTYCAAADTPLVASGLEVQAGATLTLPENYTGGHWAQIALAQAVTINGTVTAAEGVSLSIESGNLDGAIPVGLFQIGAAGLVTTKPATPGTDGAYIVLRGDGIAINLGTIDASGSDATAAATSGGAAGYITFSGNTDIYNTGSVLAKGGASALDAGGHSADIGIYAYAGTLYHSGIIDNSGGNGATTGGNAGWITLQGGSGYDSQTDTYITGSVIAGGFLTNNSGVGGSDHAGYHQGYIQIMSYGGKTWSNATINAQGGSSDAGEGGDGGRVSLLGYGGYGGIDDVQTEGIEVGGTITLSGGNGATRGGDGGAIGIDIHDDSDMGLLGVPMPSPTVWMKGFDRLTMNGGAGVTTGGGGGVLYIFTYPHWTANAVPGGSRVPVGAIFNQVPIFAKGGAATDGEGGFGRMAAFVQNTGETLLAPLTIISNSGAIDVSGGTGVTGGNSGAFGILGVSLVENSGAITGRGGAGTTTGGNGASFEDLGGIGIMLYTPQTVNNSGAIDISGGAGATTGGNGGWILADAGYHLWNSAAMTAAGGAGTANGGNGGIMNLSSEILKPTSNTGSLTAPGGTGATPGANGSISID